MRSWRCDDLPSLLAPTPNPTFVLVRSTRMVGLKTNCIACARYFMWNTTCQGGICCMGARFQVRRAFISPTGGTYYMTHLSNAHAVTTHVEDTIWIQSSIARKRTLPLPFSLPAVDVKYRVITSIASSRIWAVECPSFFINLWCNKPCIINSPSVSKGLIAYLDLSLALPCDGRNTFDTFPSLRVRTGGL